jgi:hypothetical protein
MESVPSAADGDLPAYMRDTTSRSRTPQKERDDATARAAQNHAGQLVSLLSVVKVHRLRAAGCTKGSHADQRTGASGAKKPVWGARQRPQSPGQRAARPPSPGQRAASTERMRQRAQSSERVRCGAPARATARAWHRARAHYRACLRAVLAAGPGGGQTTRC